MCMNWDEAWENIDFRYLDHVLPVTQRLFYAGDTGTISLRGKKRVPLIRVLWQHSTSASRKIAS